MRTLLQRTVGVLVCMLCFSTMADFAMGQSGHPSAGTWIGKFQMPDGPGKGNEYEVKVQIAEPTENKDYKPDEDSCNKKWIADCRVTISPPLPAEYKKYREQFTQKVLFKYGDKLSLVEEFERLRGPHAFPTYYSNIPTKTYGPEKVEDRYIVETYPQERWPRSIRPQFYEMEKNDFQFILMPKNTFEAYGCLWLPEVRIGFHDDRLYPRVTWQRP